MQQSPPPPPNDPFSPLIEAWQQAFLKTLHDPQAAESLWRGWSQLAGQWGNLGQPPVGEGVAAAPDPDTDAGAATATQEPAFQQLVLERLSRIEARLAALEARVAGN
jgi:hypothetical protein